MSPARPGQWVLSFADLTLLLLAFFVLLHARADGHAAAASVRRAFGGGPAAAPLDLAAPSLFEPGEAVLRDGAAERLRALGARWARAGRVRIGGRGGDASGHRLDAWELTAARLAVIARGLAAGGADPKAIELEMPGADQRGGPQHFEAAAS